MKKYILIMTIFISTLSLFAQDRYPYLSTFKTINNGNNKSLESSHSEYKQDRLVLGWHWDGNVFLNDSLYSNQSDVGAFTFKKYPNIYNKYHNTMFTLQADINPSDSNFKRANSHYDDRALFHFRSAQYEAGLLNTSKDDYLKYKDINNPVFGFRYQNNRGEIITEDDNKLLRYQTINNLDPYLILKNIYPKSFIKEAKTWEPPINENDTTYIKDYLDYCENYNGRFLYLAIRLKCLDCDYIDTINSKPVLSLRVPVKYYNAQINSSLLFSNLPDPNHNAVEIVRANDGQNTLMGRRRKLDLNKSKKQNEFMITDHMLMNTNLNHPDYTTGFSSIYRDYPGYITIYAKII